MTCADIHDTHQCSAEREKRPGDDVEKPSTGEPSAKKSFSRERLRCGLVTLLFLLYGAVLLALLVKNYYPEGSAIPVLSDPPGGTDPPVTQNAKCDDLLKPIGSNDINNLIFSGKWILQEAYSSDSIDQYALTHSLSSWAEFTREPNGTIYLHMSHMLSVPNRTIWCVYHHFPNITMNNDTLHLNLPQYNASAKIQFLKACNECLILTAQAFVPGYEALDYLLAYGLHPEIDEYYLRPTREQAKCKKLVPPAPFQYKGANFCPNDDEAGIQSHETREMDFRSIFFPRLQT